MSLLLAPDPVELYPPAGADVHGWALPGSAPSWAGLGNLQMIAGRSDPRAADAGGAGPHSPAASEAGTLYLPPEAAPAEGMGALVRGLRYVLSQVRLMADPTFPEGGLTCWAAAATRWVGDDG